MKKTENTVCICGRVVSQVAGRGRRKLTCSDECAARRRRLLAGTDPSLRCGCGRDYLTVPLEDAHRCTNPILPSPHG